MNGTEKRLHFKKTSVKINVSEEEVMAKIAITSQTKNGGGTTRRAPAGELAEIQQLAYQFFVDRGYQHGYDQEDWARAEAIVRNRKRA
jgi:hypothetical protein